MGAHCRFQPSDGHAVNAAALQALVRAAYADMRARLMNIE